MPRQELQSALTSIECFEVNKDVAVTSEDICIFCRDRYYPYYLEGCRPVQLLPCGHIVGASCFETWIRAAANTCPFTYHPIQPKAPSLYSSFDGGMKPIQLLRWISNTNWFRGQDDGVDEFASRFEEFLNHPNLEFNDSARTALANGTITFSQAMWLFCTIMVIHYLWIMLMVSLFVFAYMLLLGRFSFSTTVPTWVWIAVRYNRYAFGSVVLCIIGTGLVRRKRQ